MKTNGDAIREYEELIQSRRPGAFNSLIPRDHRVNWNDAPSKFNIYVESTRIPLSGRVNCKKLCIAKFDAAPPISQSRIISIEEISDFLLLTTGILRRKLSLNWILDGIESSTHRRTTYARGTASGGGLYPILAYLVVGDDVDLQEGVYHYDDAHHGLVRLQLGNFEPSVVAALNFEDTNPPNLWVILTVRFWKSAFKYHNFSYQVVTQDVGAVIGSMELVAHALGWNVTVVYWFKDKLLSSLLGLHIDEEAPLAVLSLRKGASRHNSQHMLENATGMNRPIHNLPNARHRAYERSRKPSLPKLLSYVHSETLLEEVRRPSLPPSSWPLNSAPIPRETIEGDLHSILMRRETNWGLLRREPALEAEVLGRLLHFVAYGARYNTDLYGCPAAVPSLRIALISRTIVGLPQGVYDYDFSNAQLSLRAGFASQSSLQSIYFLTNHNLDQISAVLVVVGRIATVLGALGGRGIRVMNAEAGMAAQRAYIAAASLSIGCGAALGFDARQISELLSLDGRVEIPLLLIFVGNQSDPAFAYDFALC
jgi:SagB-type dehydrogenase family enzyme